MTARDLCLAERIEDGRKLTCRKSPSHTDNRNPLCHPHYDPDADVRWSDDEEQQ